MKYKGTLILLVLLALSGLYLYFVELPARKTEKEREEQASRVVPFKSDEAVALALSYPGRSTDPEILLEKDPDQTWRVVKPMEVPADQNEVQSLLSSLHTMRVERVVEEKARDLTIYGLDHPEVKVSLKLQDHEEHLWFGHAAPIGSTVYVMRAGEDKVLLTDDFYKKGLTKTVLDLRRKNVLLFEPHQIQSVKLQYSGKAYGLSKENEKWWIKEPRVYRADDDEVMDLLNRLERLKAKDFVDVPGPRLLKSLQKPRFKAELQKEGGEQVSLSIYPSEVQQQAYAVTDLSHPIYMIEAAGIAALEKDLFTLRDKHLLAFEPDQVQGIEIQKAGEDPLTLRRVGSDWEFDGRTLEESQKNKMTDLLRDLKELEAEKIADEHSTALRPYGLHEPRLLIHLMDSQKKKIAELLIGDKKDNWVYAKAGSSETVYLIKDEIIQNLPKKSDLQKQAASSPIP